MTETAWILGAGPIGVSMAKALRITGVTTKLVEADPDAADRARHMLRDGAGLVVVVDHSGFEAGTADLVLDALGEEIEQRRAFFERFGRDLPEKATLGTTSHPGRVRGEMPPDLRARLVGFHLCEPSDVRRLVEITATDTSPTGSVSRMHDLARGMGKTSVQVNPSRPSIAKRLHRRIAAVCDSLLMQGAIAHELDEALVDFGFDIGFFEAEDLIGLDVSRSGTSGSGGEPGSIAERMVQEGRLGRKVGVGWYRYPGGGGAVIDPLVEDLVREEAWFAKVSQRDVPGGEAVPILLEALRSEGRLMLTDGTAGTAQDIEQVAVLALGYPASQGNLML